MKLIPVLDIMDGIVVRGVAGRRESYAAIQSELVNSSEPRDVARAFRRELGLTEIYVADLDAIMLDSPQWSIVRDLAADGFHLLVDAGLRDAARAKLLIDAGASRVIAALETLPGSAALRAILAVAGNERVVFSLDLMAGQPLGDLAGWETADPLAIVRRAIESGATALLVLDLSAVGVGGGVPTQKLCGEIRREFPHVTLISGGGIRNLADLWELQHSGIDAALVASALHNREIGRDEIASLEHTIGK